MWTCLDCHHQSNKLGIHGECETCGSQAIANESQDIGIIVTHYNERGEKT